MTITQLQQILAISEYQSISKTARALYISQPSLSMTLNDVEDELGVKIFERSQKGVHPTKDGAQILATIRQILALVNDMNNYGRSQEDYTGVITVYVGPAYEFLVPDIILRFREVCPRAKICIRDNTQNFPNLADEIAKRHCNFAIGAVDFANANIVSEPMMEVGISLIVHKDHPLGKKDKISVADISAMPLITVDGAILEEIHKVNVRHIKNQQVPLHLPDRYAAFELVERNKAGIVTAVPLGIPTYELIHQNLKVIPVYDLIKSEPWLTYLSYYKSSNMLECLLLETLKNLLVERGIIAKEKGLL